jgi:hypothetical protein
MRRPHLLQRTSYKTAQPNKAGSFCTTVAAGSKRTLQLRALVNSDSQCFLAKCPNERREHGFCARARACVWRSYTVCKCLAHAPIIMPSVIVWLYLIFPNSHTQQDFLREKKEVEHKMRV